MPQYASSYVAPKRLPGGYLQTIYPAIFACPPALSYQRIRIVTPDDDFLDLDTIFTRSPCLAVLSHGLEGHSQRPYITEMARALHHNGFDIVAWNFRGCSGEPNRKVFSYHGGATNDLQTVLDHIWLHKHYEQVVLVGFSLGGNLTLRYLGDAGTTLDHRIKAGIAISVPCDFESSAQTLDHWSRRPFVLNFMRTLRLKIETKARLFPNEISSTGFDEIKTFRQFDERYIAPYFGFRSAQHYWQSVSCKPVLSQIQVPVFVLNAANDPFLTPDCFPVDTAEKCADFHLEMPKSGGHNGFPFFSPGLRSFAPSATIRFLSQYFPLLNSCQHLADSPIF
ncbi:MAG TPA: alpha/beta fold hydrolase [Rhodothermales bacterium]|nr:alpha/beta fold hydrolase [Rhodothermales bacterium]HRR08876.1 alpha/beta fold hydrolase [Rhodothermales bacterium]